MKKAAKKSMVRSALTVPAALCFFCAVLSIFLFQSHVRYGSYADAQDRNRVFEAMFSTYETEIIDSLRSYYEGGNASDASPNCPPLLAADRENGVTRPRSNLLFFVEERQQTNDRAHLIKFSNNFSEQPIDWDHTFFYRSENKVFIGKQWIPELHDLERHTVKIQYVIPTDTLSAKDGFYYVRTFMQLGEELHSALLAASIVFATLTVLFCALYLRSAVREGALAHGRARLFRELPPDLLLIVLLPMMLFCGNRILVWDADAEWLRFVRNGADSARLLLPALYGLGVFVPMLVLTAVVLFSLRRCGIRGLLAYTRYEKAPFTYKTVPALLILQGVKAASIIVYSQALSHMMIYLLLEKVVLLPVLYRCLREIRLIASQTEVYVQGDLSHPIADLPLYTNLRSHAADIDAVAQRIRMSADEYIRSGQFKAELITNLSHDIKTPLTSIINYAALLQNPELSARDRARYLDVLSRHSQRLSRLVEDLTQVADAQKGRIEAHPERLDLSSLVIQSAMGFEERLQARNVTIRFLVPDAPVYVMADARLMWRVADNLMNNICKYAAPDSEVKIGVSERDGKACAYYSNIPETKLELAGDALMERFVRADSSRHTEGSGLGLSIARSILHVQAGELRIETKPDRFTAYVLLDTIDEKGDGPWPV